MNFKCFTLILLDRILETKLYNLIKAAGRTKFDNGRTGGIKPGKKGKLIS
jgi:hypothetical protein